MEVILDGTAAIIVESVPQIKNVSGPILMKLAAEVGHSELFQKPSLFCSLTFGSKVSKGYHLGPSKHEKSCF